MERLEAGQRRIKAEIRRIDERLDGVEGRLKEIKVKLDRVAKDHEPRITALEAKANSFP